MHKPIILGEWVKKIDNESYLSSIIHLLTWQETDSPKNLAFDLTVF